MSCADAPAPVLAHLASAASSYLVFAPWSGRGTARWSPDWKQQSQEKTNKPRRKVLVVDDETLIADTVAEILNRHGYQAVAVYGSKEALQQANSICPDIVLCDIIMPQVNGVETAMALRCACPAARIILFSGQAASSALLDRARAQGHEFEVLAKPIHPRELLRQLAPKQ